MKSPMRPVREVAPIIKKIYAREVKSKLGKIDRISEGDYIYRVIIEDVDKARMVAEVKWIDIDNYFDENKQKKESAKRKIIEALNSFKPTAV